MSRPQGHSAAWRIKSMKNSSNAIGNRTRDLTACSAVPQPSSPPRAPTLLDLIALNLHTQQYKTIRFTFNYQRPRVVSSAVALRSHVLLGILFQIFLNISVASHFSSLFPPNVLLNVGSLNSWPHCQTIIWISVVTEFFCYSQYYWYQRVIHRDLSKWLVQTHFTVC